MEGLCICVLIPIHVGLLYVSNTAIWKKWNTFYTSVIWYNYPPKASLSLLVWWDTGMCRALWGGQEAVRSLGLHAVISVWGMDD